jgi:hypothetical protein
VNRDTNIKDRRRKMAGLSNKTDQSAPQVSGASQGTKADGGLSPALQAHIGRHVRAVFDEVAREPIPEHLLRLLKDLEQSGDK